jgi:hypothetical protein
VSTVVQADRVVNWAGWGNLVEVGHIGCCTHREMGSCKPGDYIREKEPGRMGEQGGCRELGDCKE